MASRNCCGTRGPSAWFRLPGNVRIRRFDDFPWDTTRTRCCSFTLEQRACTIRLPANQRPVSTTSPFTPARVGVSANTASHSPSHHPRCVPARVTSPPSASPSRRANLRRLVSGGDACPSACHTVAHFSVIVRIRYRRLHADFAPFTAYRVTRLSVRAERDGQYGAFGTSSVYSAAIVE
jgi:hypothetical protein